MAPFTVPLNAPLAALVALRDRPASAETTRASPEALHAARSDAGRLRIVTELSFGPDSEDSGVEEGR